MTIPPVPPDPSGTGEATNARSGCQADRLGWFVDQAGLSDVLTDLSRDDITALVLEPGSVDPHSLLPLPAAAMYILTSLGEGPSHGYRIMATVEDLSGGTVRLGPGTLYGSLKRMAGQGLIEEVDERPAPELDDGRRRYYRLTAFGEQVAAIEVDRLTRLAEAGRRHLPAVTRPAPGFA